VDPGIVNLSIESFRSFHELKLDGLGRVNLITGRNNTGRSSLLQALHLLASNFPPATIRSILTDREENVSDGEEAGRQEYAEVAVQVLILFLGFPELSGSWELIVVAADGPQPPMKLTLTLSWFSEERAENGTRKYVRRCAYGRRHLRPEYERLILPPCVYVSPHSGESTEQLGVLWDRIALSDLEAQVVEALCIIDPSIATVSMVRAIYRGVRVPQSYVPIRSSARCP